MLPTEELISIGAGGSVSVLLTVIAYFLRILVQDIRDLKREQRELRELCNRLKTEQGDLREYLEKETFYQRSGLPSKRKPKTGKRLKSDPG